jgi:hypothetical protein
MPSLGPAFTFLEIEGSALLGPVRSMLYVGHRGDTSPWWRTLFRDALGGPELAVIDIQAGNLQTAAPHVSRLIHGDIRTCAEARGFDLVFWDEGPEHVPREDALLTLSGLIPFCRVLVSCPWGYQPQGATPTDPEFHHWGPEPEDFAEIDMPSRCFGVRFHDGGQGHGNLIAWST